MGDHLCRDWFRQLWYPLYPGRYYEYPEMGLHHRTCRPVYLNVLFGALLLLWSLFHYWVFPANISADGLYRDHQITAVRPSDRHHHRWPGKTENKIEDLRLFLVM